VDKPEDSKSILLEKAALRCVASKIFKSEFRKSDAAGIIKNFNNINKPGFRCWSKKCFINLSIIGR
jgi:hypothetical protein